MDWLPRRPGWPGRRVESLEGGDGTGNVVNDANLRRRVGEARRRLAVDGPPWTRALDGDFDRVAAPQRDCDRLRDLLISEGAGTVVEIGLAYGSSALAIGEALVAVGTPRPRHVIIDPLQATVWRDVGLAAAAVG